MCNLPDQCMLPASAADNKDFHENYLAENNLNPKGLEGSRKPPSVANS